MWNSYQREFARFMDHDPDIPHGPKFRCAIYRRKLHRAGFTEVLNFENNHLRAQRERQSDDKTIRKERKRKDERNGYNFKKKQGKRNNAGSSSRR